MRADVQTLFRQSVAVPNAADKVPRDLSFFDDGLADNARKIQTEKQRFAK